MVQLFTMGLKSFCHGLRLKSDARKALLRKGKIC